MERTESAEVQSTVHCMSTDVDEKVVSSTHSVGVDIWRSENGNTWRDLSGVGEYNGERHAGDGDKQWGATTVGDGLKEAAELGDDLQAVVRCGGGARQCC